MPLGKVKIPVLTNAQVDITFAVNKKKLATQVGSIFYNRKLVSLSCTDPVAGTLVAEIETIVNSQRSQCYPQVNRSRKRTDH
jgi:hypothetical protein